MKRKYFKQTRILLSILLALMLIVSPVALVKAEVAPENELTSVEVIKELFGEEFQAKMAEANELAKKPFKSNSSVSIEFGPNMMMPADELELISNLAVNLDFQVAMAEIPATLIDVNVKNKQFEGSAIQVKSYNVGDKQVLEMPNILEKPIVLDVQALIESMEGMEGMPLNVGFSMESQMEILEIVPPAMQDLMTAILNFRAKFTEQGVQPVTLTIGELSEDLVANESIMPANEFIAAAKEFLTEIRDSEALEKYMDDYVFKSMSMAYTATGEEVPASYAEAIDQAIADLEKETEVNNESHVRLSEYVTAEGEFRGYSLGLFDAEKQADTFAMDFYVLSDESGKHTPFTMIITGPDDEEESGYSSVIIEVDLNEVEENVYAGSYKLVVPQQGEVVSGTFDNATTVEVLPGREELVGNFDTTIKVVQTVATYSSAEVAEEVDPATEELASEGEAVEEPAAEENPATEEVVEDPALEEMPATEGEIVYEEIESFVGFKVEISSEAEGKLKTVVTVTPDKNLEGQFIKVIVDSDLEELAEPTIPTELPADAMEVKSEEDLNALGEDPEFQERVMNAVFGLMGQEAPEQ